ncbi:metallophosphoesterase family protein [Bosea rubneri]|uniref:Phosphoesterase n=1 Tax=Bosea rubneri TaxID=3075434 RepID=A0ABU3SE40_9HYPH|nr:YfcE family phosphodiesterase [Bosea sp. ZW T0_25]MDU0342672.1 YfcE family phosphodiesterase [Bosea sp. ZW T0_25]
MKIVIVSDIHGNFDALRALPESFDELWVLGDLVNYGPQPAEVVEQVKSGAAVVIQGNHDHAVANDDDSRWSARYRQLSECCRKRTVETISHDQKQYLGDLPLRVDVERHGTRFHLTHATPSDPHYGKCADENWPRELSDVDADILLVGHSHVPFLGRFGSKTVLNPGSIGQPRNGSTAAHYAVWEDGELSLRSFAYPVETTIARLQAMALPSEIEAELSMILRTGAVK